LSFLVPDPQSRGELYVGTPRQGDYPVTLDTGSSDPWVLGYRAKNYEFTVVAPFQASKSKTYKVRQILVVV